MRYLKIYSGLNFCMFVLIMIVDFNIMGTYLQEGPNSQMKEEEFYDAVDAGLDRLDEKFDEMMV